MRLRRCTANRSQHVDIRRFTRTSYQPNSDGRGRSLRACIVADVGGVCIFLIISSSIRYQVGLRTFTRDIRANLVQLSDIPTLLATNAVLWPMCRRGQDVTWLVSLSSSPHLLDSRRFLKSAGNKQTYFSLSNYAPKG